MAKRPRQKPPASPTPAATPAPKPAMKISRAALDAVAASPAERVTPWAIPKPAPGVGPTDARLAMDSGFNDLYAYANNGYDGAINYGDGIRFMGYPVLAELLLRSEYRRMVGTLAQEMTRRWMRITSTGDDDKGDKIRQLTAAMKRHRVQDVFREGAEHDGAFGVGHIYIDTGDGANPNELKTPLVASKMKIKRGSLKGIRAVEPIWCYPGQYDSTNPLSQNFYRPETWYVMSTEIHRSRFLTLVSREVPDLLKPAFMFGGVSLSQLAKPTIDNWLRTRESVSDLLHSFTVWQLATDMSAFLAGGSSDDLVTRAETFARFRDNRGMMLTNKDTELLTNVSAPLGSLDHLQAQSQEQQAAVDGMPLIKLVGYTPSGLNSTGEGEMDAWRDRVRAQQEHLFNAPLKHVMDVIQLSEFGEIDPDIGFEWESLEDPDEVERATVRKTDAETAVAYINAGVLEPQEERERLASEDGSAYANLDLSVIPEPETDEFDPTADPTAPPPDRTDPPTPGTDPTTP
jgi:uncharacterized protein